MTINGHPASLFEMLVSLLAWGVPLMVLGGMMVYAGSLTLWAGEFSDEPEFGAWVAVIAGCAIALAGLILWRVNG